MKAAIGRADLARLLATLKPDQHATLAALLGYVAPVARESRVAPAPSPDDAGLLRDLLPGPSPVPPPSVKDTEPMVFWRVEEVSYTEEKPSKVLPPPGTEGLTDEDWESPGRSLFASPRTPPLARWSRLWPLLRRQLQTTLPGRDPDVSALVRQWSRGETVLRVPRLVRRVWAPRARVYLDRSARLVPFWEDQSEVCDRLSRVFERGTVEVRVLDAYAQARAASHGDLFEGERFDPATPVLVLGDLGAYASARVRGVWLQAARRLRREGVRVSALVPSSPLRWDREVARAWSASRWERGHASYVAMDAVSVEARAERLLTLASPAVLVQPGLLRELRELLPASEADASTEVDVWRHRDVRAADATGMVLRASAVQGWRDRFVAVAKNDPVLARRVRETIARWHATVPREMARAETLISRGLMPDDAALSAEEITDAERFAERLQVSARAVTKDTPATMRFARSLLGTMPDATLQKMPSLQRVWAAAFRGQSGVRVPVGVDAEGLYRELDTPGPLTHWSVRQVGAELVVQRAEGSAWPSQTRDAGSPIACIEATRGQLTVAAFEAEVPQEDALESWMAATGVDDYGRWAAVNLCDVMVRFRWIPPGTFTMGSPESEEGRNYDEGPQHEVTLTQGYWMADTPVTQALWTAVMGENPSHFKGAERPVEGVSWDDCQRFIETLRTCGPGFDVRLPTEAEWEYACRAGTATATWLGNGNPEVLDAIAWYSDNSDGETHAVRGKQPNPYGLHDMLGNVSEWCANCWSTYSAHETDPYVAAGGADRVIRGGSWNDDARLVRAAYCVAYLPGVRFHSLGFRLVRAQAQGQRAEPLAAERPVPRGAGRDERPMLHALTQAPRVPLRASTALSLRTDRSTIVVAPWQRERWASAAGRDRYGLWAEARVGDAVLRLRWIPPGRFVMGSPQGEAGRSDSEGPQHEVTFTEGRWMADAPVTQALWTAVMGENPSRFVSAERPVEKVNWDDCKAFIVKLNAAVPGLGARLPSEAEWEYACRAGTRTATWVGDLVIRGSNNAPMLDAIAWYGGNSGVGFELESGVDSSGWPEKQHEHVRAGTHTVRTREANPLGLYDMLGNVWEWCEDWHAPYSEGAVIDPKLPPEGSSRVIRGGSWLGDARVVRAAFRYAYHPDYLYDVLGFRLVRGPALTQGTKAVDGEGAAARRALTKKGAKR